jgi:hypothetical protein
MNNGQLTMDNYQLFTINYQLIGDRGFHPILKAIIRNRFLMVILTGSILPSVSPTMITILLLSRERLG